MIPRATDRTTLAAFIAIVVLGGGNGVAVRFSDHEIAPLWGATLRFAIASIVLFAVVALMRLPLPRGRALVGSALYGLFAFAGAFGFIYWGLVQTPAGLGQIILALVPLLTLLLAVAHGLERFRWQGLFGTLIAIAGIAVVFGDRIGTAVPILSALAIVVAAACMAESNVIAKLYGGAHPVTRNAIAMGLGAVILFLASQMAAEPRALPAQGQTWLAIAYVSVIGSVVVFSLFLFVIGRWSASASSYVMLLMPLVAVAAAAALDHETVTAAYFGGGALVLGGVYVGAFAPPIRQWAARLSAGQLPGPASVAAGAAGQPVAAEEPGPNEVATPGCA